jgi:hypothetical protein
MKKIIKNHIVYMLLFGVIAQTAEASVSRAICMAGCATAYYARILVCDVVAISKVEVCATILTTTRDQSRYDECMAEANNDKDQCYNEAQEKRETCEEGCPAE